MFNIFTKISQILTKQYLTTYILNTVKLPSAILLICANLIPIFGIIFLGWNSYDIVILYWLENVVVGIYNVARMPFASKFSSSQSKNFYTPFINWCLRIFLTFFFILHYSGFTLGHAMFLKFLAIPNSTLIGTAGYQQIGIFFVALMISHGFSYFYNFWYKQEYKTRNILLQMIQPYKRIVILQVTIILGIFLSLIIDSSAITIVLVIMKILIDLKGHLNIHTQLFSEEEKLSHINYIAPKQ